MLLRHSTKFCWLRSSDTRRCILWQRLDQSFGRSRRCRHHVFSKRRYTSIKPTRRHEPDHYENLASYWANFCTSKDVIHFAPSVTRHRATCVLSTAQWMMNQISSPRPELTPLLVYWSHSALLRFCEQVRISTSFSWFMEKLHPTWCVSSRVCNLKGNWNSNYVRETRVSSKPTDRSRTVWERNTGYLTFQNASGTVRMYATGSLADTCWKLLCKACNWTLTDLVTFQCFWTEIQSADVNIIIIIMIIIIIISLCRVFILIFLRQSMSLGNTLLQPFCCSYSWCIHHYFQCWIYCTFTLVLSTVCVQCPVWLFYVAPWVRGFLVRCSGTFWMILKWFQLPLLLVVSHLFLHFKCAVFLL